MLNGERRERLGGRAQSREGGEWRKPNKFPLESPLLLGLGLRMNEREAQRANK